MSKLDHQIRAKRYKVKDSINLVLIVEFATGTQFRIRVKDCSQTGIRGTLIDAVESEMLNHALPKFATNCHSEQAIEKIHEVVT